MINLFIHIAISREYVIITWQQTIQIFSTKKRPSNTGLPCFLLVSQPTSRVTRITCREDYYIQYKASRRVFYSIESCQRRGLLHQLLQKPTSSVWERGRFEQARSLRECVSNVLSCLCIIADMRFCERKSVSAASPIFLSFWAIESRYYVKIARVTRCWKNETIYTHARAFLFGNSG